MTNASDTMSDDYEEYDEFDDDDERGLSGFSVLVIGLVMIGAFISVVWIAYTQGIRTGADGLAGGTPYVVADPEPIKIASADDSAPADDREVYDVFDGESETPVTVLAEGPEEPVARVQKIRSDRLLPLQKMQVKQLMMRLKAAPPACLWMTPSPLA
ncbi:MAG: hypothetical protein GXP04_08895 [Alphaproteobacteria bacterium]|nr:hypothetical protein [Alphaproteobacteria bacterium]